MVYKTWELKSFYINLLQSKLLNVNLNLLLANQIKRSIPFIWSNEAITYLGIKVPADPLSCLISTSSIFYNKAMITFRQFGMNLAFHGW